MAWAIRNDLYFCLTDRCVIFLDLDANRYFGLTGSADLAFRNIVSGDAIDDRLERALRPLLSLGYIRQVDQVRAISQVTLEEPAAVCVPGRTSFRGKLSALLRQTSVRAELRVLGLKGAIRRRHARKQRARRLGNADPLAIASVLAAHQYVDQMLGGADRCLARSLAFIDHLASFRIYPNLVIGVRAGAFAANCWVQQDGVVLNDSIDRIRLFTPILVQ